METRELILQTAIEQFNALGTARVTTNLIAKEAGISPGNLYYHFSDKAHIIREIYEHMIRAWESAYEEVEGEFMPNDALENFVKVNFELLWRYRFFYRETVALMNADPLLRQRHIDVTQARFQRQRLFLQRQAQQGVLRFTDPEKEMDDVLTIAWIVANHYLIHLESLGKTVDKRDFETGAALVMKVLQPYLA